MGKRRRHESESPAPYNWRRRRHVGDGAPAQRAEFAERDLPIGNTITGSLFTNTEPVVPLEAAGHDTSV
ncbi:hypothetical protein BLA14095_00549 [Burkholderia lata]|nr:hypothetical protein BLA14095_00549 [Burkholderia lata]